MRSEAAQCEMEFRSWGRRRAGAGRKPNDGRRSTPHRARPVHRAYQPVHVTLRAMRGLPSFCRARLVEVIRATIAKSHAGGFRILQFSTQADHLHLLVEADGSESLWSGVQGFVIRAAKAINRALGRRGRVWGDRFHSRELATPREVGNAIVYVLQNWTKHVRGARGLDPCSSAGEFYGWIDAVVGVRRIVAAPKTWLARVGWMRWGRLRVDEGPQLSPKFAHTAA
jgi:REP element-mobilizing transposase RayT